MDMMEYLKTTKALMNKVVEVETNASNKFNLGTGRDVFEQEFQALALYVAGTDNNISSEEIDLFNYMFDMNMDSRDFGALIKELSGMYNDIINNLRLPGWLVCKSLKKKTSSDITNTYIEVVKMVMELFAAVDNVIDPKEEAFINNFVTRLRNDR